MSKIIELRSVPALVLTTSASLFFTLALLAPIHAAESGSVHQSFDQGKAEGVTGKALLLGGNDLKVLAKSQAWTADPKGFGLDVWVNVYDLNRGQQMVAGKNVYALNQRQWGLMLDKDKRFRLYLWQGKWVTVDTGVTPAPGVWTHLAVSVGPNSATVFVNGKPSGTAKLTKLIAPTDAPVTVGGINNNGRPMQTLWGAVDELKVYDEPLTPKVVAKLYRPTDKRHVVPAPPTQKKTPPKNAPTKSVESHKLWTGPPIPKDLMKIPFVAGMTHRTIHQATEQTDKFLHGASMTVYKGVIYANWANSPVHENYPNEKLKGRRSSDGGKTWSKVETIAPGFEGSNRHSHGVVFEYKGELWAIAARFGVGQAGKRFKGLGGEAFVLDPKTNQWKSRGEVLSNCWPFNLPMKTADGNYITGGMNRDGYPVVAISRGDNITVWDTISISFPPALKPSYAETSVSVDGNHIMAMIRGGGNVAWIATSADGGKTWNPARPSNLPMPRAKPHLGRLSDGRLYALHNVGNRDTLAISVGEPNKRTLNKIYRIRHGKSVAPRFKGNAKGKQWSYPFGYEYDGKLFVLYSIGKEDCGMSVLPIESLK
jgi:hypothetical protein